MGQANTPPPAPFLFLMMIQRELKASATLIFVLMMSVAVAKAQTTRSAGSNDSPSADKGGVALTPEKAMTLAEQGRCREAIPVLRKAVTAAASKDERKRAGVLGLRCAMSADDRLVAGEMLGQLRRQFPNDPEVLYIAAHAYSELSGRAAGELAQKAPFSVQARRMNAEALELQGKWDDAAKEYEAILAQNPKEPGIHFLIARMLFSRTDAGAGWEERAKQELQKELEIDPRNAVAEFLLGEIAKKALDWDQAITHFSRAATLDAGFGEAFMEWGFALVSAKRYEEAVAPLRNAVKLQPGNPAAHYNLGMALSRTGNTAEAEKEFAIQRQINAAIDERKNTRPEDRKPE
jgi:tetratricopeptide (TPR) repeat protein